METSGSDARDSLVELERVQMANEQRMRRPGRYWMMVGFFLAVYALSPLIADVVPGTYKYALPGLAILVIALAFLWRRPRVKQVRYTLNGAMMGQLVVFALSCGVVSAANIAAYSTLGWWWVPLVAAVLLVGIGFFGGRAMDRHWARTVSRRV